MLLTNTVVVVTGGAGLLGRAFVRAILEEGGTAVIADVNPTAAKRVKADMLASIPGASVEVATLDITSKASIARLIARCMKRHGRVDALVNGAYPRTARYGRDLEEVEYEDFCENVNLHLGGYFLCTQQFAMHFARHGGGSIVNISSIYGVVPPRFDVYEGTGLRNSVEYAVIKSGLQHMSRYFVRYYAGKNVRINLISPGGILDRQPERFLENYRRHCQNKGMLDPQDICGTLVFLLSDKSRYINGQNIIVDDGFTL